MSYSKCQEIGGPVEAFALDLEHEKQPESQKKNPHRLSGWCISLFAPILIFPNHAIN